MKIKLLKKCLGSSASTVHPVGTVLQAKNKADETNFAELVSMGYAVEVKGDKPEPAAPPAPPVPADGDLAILEVLKGNAEQVIAEIGAFNKEELQRALVLEAAGKARKGVSEAITAALEAE